MIITPLFSTTELPPVFSTVWISDTVLAVGGGGGAAKSGIANFIAVYDVGDDLSIKRVSQYEPSTIVVRMKPLAIAGGSAAVLQVATASSVFTLAPDKEGKLKQISDSMELCKDGEALNVALGDDCAIVVSSGKAKLHKIGAEPRDIAPEVTDVTSAGVAKDIEGQEFYVLSRRDGSIRLVTSTGKETDMVILDELPPGAARPVVCDGSLCAVGHSGGYILVGQGAVTERGVALEAVRQKFSGRRPAAIGLGGDLMVAVSPEGFVRVWTGGKHETDSKIQDTRGLFTCCSVSPDGKHIAIGSAAGCMYIYGVHSTNTRQHVGRGILLLLLLVVILFITLFLLHIRPSSPIQEILQKLGIPRGSSVQAVHNISKNVSNVAETVGIREQDL